MSKLCTENSEILKACLNHNSCEYQEFSGMFNVSSWELVLVLLLIRILKFIIGVIILTSFHFVVATNVKLCTEVLDDRDDFNLIRPFFDQNNIYDSNDLHKIARDLAVLEYSLSNDSHIRGDFIARTRLLEHFNDELRKFILLDRVRNLQIYFEEREKVNQIKLIKNRIQTESEQIVIDEVNRIKETVLVPKEKYTLTSESRKILDILISPDDQHLVLRLMSGGIQVRELLNNRELYSRSLSSPIGNIQLAIENEMLMTNCYDHQTKIGSLEFGNLKNTSVAKSFINNRSMNDSSFSPNGKYFYTSEIPNTIDIREFPTGEILYQVIHFQDIGHINFSEDSQYLLTASSDGRVKITALATGKEVDAFDLPNDQLFIQSVSSSRFHPNGSTLILSTSKKIIVRDYIQRLNLKTFQHAGSPRLFATNGDGNYDITGYQPAKVFVRNILTGEESSFAHLQSMTHVSTEFINGVEVLITADSSGIIQLRDLETNMLLHTVSHQKQILKVILIPGTQYLISSSVDKTVRITDLKTDTTVYTFEHPEIVAGLKLSNDKRYLVSLSSDGTMKVTDLFSFLP